MTATNELDKVLDAVQKLLALADHPTTPEGEAKLARARAEKMMTKHRIREADLGDAVSSSTAPVLRSFPLYAFGSEHARMLQNIMGSVMHHVGAAAVLRIRSDENGVRTAYAEMVGFEIDLRYAEMVYTSARTYYESRMDTRVNPDETETQNVYRLRSAGVTRIAIAEMMGFGTTNGATKKVTSLYVAECARRGEDPAVVGRGFSVKTYRDAFTRSFGDRLWQRMYEARNAAARDYTNALPVLANRKVRVDEAFYERYPYLRPTDVPAEQKKLTDAQTVRELKRRLAERRKLDTASGRAGWTSGHDAAEAVDILTFDKKRIEN